MSIKKILVVLLAIIMCVGLAVGCSQEVVDETDDTKSEAPVVSESAEASEEVTEYLIGVNIGYPDNEFFQMVEYGIRKAFEARGWEMMFTYGGVEKITENATTLLAQGIDALVDFGCNADYGKAAVEMATEEGVPVVCIDVLYEGGYFYGANNAQAGTILGEAMADWIIENWDGQIDGIFIGRAENNGAEVEQRVLLAAKALEEKLGVSSDIEFQYDEGTTSIDGCTEAWRNYLSANPDYTHIANINLTEQYMSPLMGAAETMGRGQDCCYGSHSESSWTFELFANDPDTTYVGTVAYNPAGYGEDIAVMLETLFSGGTLPEMTRMEHYVITADNYEPYYEAYNEAKEALAN